MSFADYSTGRLSGVTLAWKEGRTRACVVLMLLVWALWAMVGNAVAQPADGSRRAARVAADLSARVAGGATAQVILRGTPDEVRALAARHGLRVTKSLRSGAVATVDRAALASLSADPSVPAVAEDRPVYPTMAVATESTGVKQVWAGLEGAGRYSGRGIGVAVIDSGVTEHGDLAGHIAAHVDFTSPLGFGRDFYGHGTHVAGIIAGSNRAVRGFKGMAPGAHLINLRVLGRDGSGLSSDVVEAIDWAIENRSRFNIRVLNVSLGHPAIEHAADDPLVQAVERAVASGIVVVASAGNLGKTADGEPVIGAISSPGNAPSVITVGALNTKGTPQRSDDVVATYSSRGPTYGDRLIKPDLVAPGNKLTSLSAVGSTLWKKYPELRAGLLGSYMTLSGTSQAAAVVAGAAALVLEANPTLKPVQVKFALQATASLMPEAGIVASGAGSLNAAAAVKMAVKGPAARKTTLTIGGESVTSGSVAFESAYADGLRGNSVIWGNSLVWGDSLTWGETLVWGETLTWGETLVWGETLTWGETLVWGETLTWGETLIWGE
jgi:serine protease AprX